MNHEATSKSPAQRLARSNVLLFYALLYFLAGLFAFQAAKYEYRPTIGGRWYGAGQLVLGIGLGYSLKTITGAKR